MPDELPEGSQYNTPEQVALINKVASAAATAGLPEAAAVAVIIVEKDGSTMAGFALNADFLKTGLISLYAHGPQVLKTTIERAAKGYGVTVLQEVAK